MYTSRELLKVGACHINAVDYSEDELKYIDGAYHFTIMFIEYDIFPDKKRAEILRLKLHVGAVDLSEGGLT